MSSLRINTSLDPEQQRLAHIKKLLAAQESIAAELASLNTPQTTHQLHRSPIHKQQQQQQQRRSNVPRSMSSSGASNMSRHLSSDRMEAAQISRSISNRSAPSMARANSRGSTSQRSGNPFSNGSKRSIPLPLEPRRESPAITAWSSQEQPFSSYTFGNNQPLNLQRSTSQHKPELERVPENSHILEDPSEYISRQFGNAITPTLAISPPVSLNNQHRLSTGSIGFPPSTPTSEALTNATTLTNNTMSRTNSLFNEPLPESLQMLRFNSNTSFSDFHHVDQSFDQVTPTFTPSCHVRRSSNEEQSQLLVGAGGVLGQDSQFSHSLPSSLASSFGEKMEKSQSNESNSSTSSRNKQRLQVQNQLAAIRPLKPKGGMSDNCLMSRKNSSQSMSRLQSKDGSQDKVAISKPTYQRPKHDRVFCKQCDCHPEGFRGEHELRRHQDREHRQRVKKWICVEPAADGRDHPTPILPLSRCKACGQQKKKYGAYYNAAAHLRRAHFRPKAPKGRSKNIKESDEKRGGKAGGDWPTMSDLKYWMKEVEEVAPKYTLTASQQDEADASDDEIDTPETTQTFINDHTLSGSENSNFDTVFDNHQLFDIYPNVNDVNGMQMPLGSHSQSMDSSMYNSSSQGTFTDDYSSNVFQNDPSMTFFSASLPQNFGDQVASTGPDSSFSYPFYTL